MKLKTFVTLVEIIDGSIFVTGGLIALTLKDVSIGLGMIISGYCMFFGLIRRCHDWKYGKKMWENEEV